MSSSTRFDDLTNIAHALRLQADDRPDGVALIVPLKRVGGRWTDRRYTYRQLNDLSDRLAIGLRLRGIGAGARVALMVPPSLEFFALFFALFKAGCVPVLIDPGIGLKSLKACLGEARPEAFIGVTRAQLARIVLGWARGHVKRSVTVGPRPLFRGLHYLDLLTENASDFVPVETSPEAPAAILFTSGSTGIPKGVVYRHRHFVAQVRLVRDTYGIRSGEVDLPTFPPFALFDPALGMTTVIPKMDFTRPAKVDPEMLVSLIDQYGVTNLFGSPALMNTLSRYLEQNGTRLPGLKRVLSAGAPVSPAVVERMHQALDPSADLHTPYGATECLPVASIGGHQLMDGLSDGNRKGLGICVGKPLPANRVRVIRITDKPLARLADSVVVDAGDIGEICVAGPTATDTYWQRDAQTRLAKMVDDNKVVWHRMGDLGWFDEQGRLWYCGRKSDRVVTESGTLFTECVEGVVNAVSGVYRSALVGIGDNNRQTPVVIVEPEAGQAAKKLVRRVRERLQLNDLTAGIKHVASHKSLPVDIRHNAKINRKKLAEWAAGKFGIED
ncbi:MAG: fatty acid CoA ligase family protein [Wenzhouxiangellaceae bacterium]|nr:fatty acid CoA ligase family protein [Wenzhouxiangellaceae bacterium]